MALFRVTAVFYGSSWAAGIALERQAELEAAGALRPRVELEGNEVSVVFLVEADDHEQALGRANDALDAVSRNHVWEVHAVLLYTQR